MKSERPEFRAGANNVRHDAQGREVCSECGQVFNARCRNCFHNRHGHEDPDESSHDVLASLPSRR